MKFKWFSHKTTPAVTAPTFEQRVTQLQAAVRFEQDRWDAAKEDLERVFAPSMEVLMSSDRLEKIRYRAGVRAHNAEKFVRFRMDQLRELQNGACS